ncbi:MAG: alginate export family protein [Bacteroidota bacterium]
MRNITCGTVIVLIAFVKAYGQSGERPEPQAPRILTTRAEEDYTSLKDNDSLDFFLKELKYISLNQNRSAYLTLGGEYRARMDHTRNGNFGTEDETSYLQRMSLHAALNFNDRFRFFTEFYHGYSSQGEVVLQSEDIDLHQVFIDWRFLERENITTSLRFGRQELGFGSSRLVGIRNGPNVRRSFDLAQLWLKLQKTKIDIFYGAEVGASSGAFDNTSTLLDSDNSNPELWGLYINRPLKENLRFMELYYLGFHSDFSAFNDVQGKETRHSFGLRSYGSFGRFTYNSELIFQAGKVDDSDVFAYNFEADWKYRLSNTGWKPQIGLKLDWSSGDQEAGDNKVGTFNPYFVNPGIYSLASVNTPANMTSLHPSVSILPMEKLYISLEYAFFYRTQTADGFYRPTRILSRPASSSDERYLGETFGLLVNYEINRNLSLDVVTYFFISGAFIEESGESENISFVAPTLSFKF